MKTFAVLVAGGSGSRMGADVPKQFLALHDKPLFIHTIEAFHSAIPDIQIILVLPEAHLQKGRELLASYSFLNNILITTGGDTRFQSVKNGLRLITGEGIVLVHDAVRCLVTPALIRRCVDETMEKSAVVPAVPATDSVRLLQAGSSVAVPRDSVRLVQTPQAFRSEALKAAFETPYEARFTDEASLMEAAGHQVHLIEGDINNIKITHPFDLILAEKILRERESTFE